MIDARDVLFVLGTGMVAAGTGFIHWPSGLIAAGVVFVYVALFHQGRVDNGHTDDD